MAEYDFTVQYRPGAKIPHADTFSRHICALASNPEVSKDKVGREQAKDAFCQSVKIGDSREKPEFFKDEDGVIYIIIISNLSNDRSKASSKTIPPHSAI